MLKRLALAALIALSTPADAEMFADAVAAFEKGDFSRALDLWRQLAELGEPAAQNNLGFMYEKGLGVRANPFVAADWYRRAAQQGDADAQVNLGVLYVTGDGVPQDLVEAHKWFDKAAAAGHTKAQQDLSKVVRMMNSDEFAQARTQARSPSDAEPAHRSETQNKIAAVPAAVTRPAAEPSGGWRVQIASLTARQNAEAERDRLRARFAFLANQELRIVKAELPKGTHYRVQVMGLRQRADATSLCETLRRENQDCFVMPPS